MHQATGRLWEWTWASRCWRSLATARNTTTHGGSGMASGSRGASKEAIARSINLNPNRRTNRRGRLYEQRARLQSQQASQRQTHHRQTASAIAKSAGTVVVELLTVAGMVRNHRLAKALSGAAVGGFLRELEWQCVKRGVRLLKAGMWFPSTQICARCGGRPNARIDLSVRLYRCHLCGWQCDRDQNAALNLKQVAPALWATIKGGGGDVSPAPGPATASEAYIGQGNHWQPPCFLVDGESMPNPSKA